jgi:uncharacterized membrane protein
MTEIEAHKFIERWDRKIFPWRAKTELKTAHRMQKLSAGIMLGMFGWMCAAISQMRHSDFYFGLTTLIFALAAGSFSFWLFAHLREANCTLGYPQIGNRKS